MTERTTAQRPIGGAFALRTRFRPWYLAAIVVVIALVLVGARLTQTPKTVDLVVQNPTKFDLSVAVAGGDNSGWMPVGPVQRGSTTTFRDVIDQGDTWTFRFSAQGENSDDVEVSRDDLARAGWKLQIPGSVSDSLLAKGAEFPP